MKAQLLTYQDGETVHVHVTNVRDLSCDLYTTKKIYSIADEDQRVHLENCPKRKCLDEVHNWMHRQLYGEKDG
jgi:hypothetical protein